MSFASRDLVPLAVAGRRAKHIPAVRWSVSVPMGSSITGGPSASGPLRDKDGQHAFRASKLGGYVRPGKTTRLVVTIRRLEAQHEVRVGQLEDWLTSGARSPREQVLKGRLRELLRPK